MIHLTAENDSGAVDRKIRGIFGFVREIMVL
jgi:hypothetical protein